jgi:DNA-binding LacI/PurR family transcriptional regulator
MEQQGGWPGGRRVTLEDVARHAAVSRSLVSIVMREAPGASRTTRQRVLAAAQELGYRPDARARALAGQKSGLIGVMFGVSSGIFQFDLLEGLYAAAEQRGLGLILSPLTRGRREQQAAESLHDFRFDGLVMLGPPTADPPLLAGAVPVVVVGWQVDHPAVDVVRTSDAHGMAQAVGHLAELGHRRIAHLDGGDTPISASRREGYADAMRDHGLAGFTWVVAGGQAQIDGVRAARALLDADDRPTALVAYNDDTAVAAIGLLALRGLDVPGRLSVVGWDDSEAAALSPVGLTTVAQAPEEMARLAIERLVDRLDGRRVDDRQIVLEPRLVVRASTRSIRNTDCS